MLMKINTYCENVFLVLFSHFHDIEDDKYCFHHFVCLIEFPFDPFDFVIQSDCK